MRIEQRVTRDVPETIRAMGPTWRVVSVAYYKADVRVWGNASYGQGRSGNWPTRPGEHGGCGGGAGGSDGGNWAGGIEYLPPEYLVLFERVRVVNRPVRA